uniref:Uncharacterized protein n=1 Tax=Zea mays TaxID=4577 RepID=C4J3F9_MAIZE|nr:unknown [Zea mays]
MEAGSSASARLQSAMASAGRPADRNAAARPTRQAVAKGCGSTLRRVSSTLLKCRTASPGSPASSAATAAARRRRRSFTCASSCDTDSASDAAALLAVSGFDGEKLSSDQHTLSRRNAAVARRRAVWRSTTASSIRPRWKQALPRTRYLHCASVLELLQKLATRRRLRSDTWRQQRKRAAPAQASERSRSPEADEQDEDDEAQVASSSPEHDLA